MIVGVVNKITGQPEGKYPSNTLRRKEPYIDETIYHIFELPSDRYIESYSWQNETLVWDSNYVPYHKTFEFQARNSITNAIIFGQELIVTFATENVLMGITQAGKTKSVSDYLADVTRYTQTGSLYEVINEIDNLIIEGIPQDLDPFVNQARLESFKSKIQNYLGL